MNEILFTHRYRTAVVLGSAHGLLRFGSVASFSSLPFEARCQLTGPYQDLVHSDHLNLALKHLLRVQCGLQSL